MTPFSRFAGRPHLALGRVSVWFTDYVNWLQNVWIVRESYQASEEQVILQNLLRVSPTRAEVPLGS